MNDWKKVKAIEFCQNVTDGTHDSPKPKSIGHYLITSKHIKDNKIDFSSANKISDDDYKQIIQRSQVEQYDILFSMIGTIGAVYRVVSDNIDYAVKNIGIFKMGKNKLKSYWLYYWLKSPIAQKYIYSRITGSTQEYITLNSLREFPIMYPDKIETQEKIAAILGCLDDKIEINNKINANLESQAQAIFKHYFVDNPQKENWKKGKAMDFYDITIGKTPPRKETKWFSKNINDIVWISISDMGQSGIYINSSSEYLTKEAVENFNIVLVPINTILLSFKLTIGRVSIANCNLTTNEAIAHFKISNNNLLEYTYFILKNYDYSKLGNTSSIGNAVNSKTIKTMPWIIPDENVLNKFHFITEKLFNKIKINQKENTIVAEIRNMLLPKLMNGEIKI